MFYLSLPAPGGRRRRAHIFLLFFSAVLSLYCSMNIFVDDKIFQKSVLQHAMPPPLLSYTVPDTLCLELCIQKN